MKSPATSSSRATRCSILGGSSLDGQGRSLSYAGYEVAVRASTGSAALVALAAAAASRCVAGETRRRRRGVRWVVRSGEEE